MKSRAVFLSRAARHDLLELYDWIAPRGGPQAAFNYIGRLEAFCRNLGTASERGYRRDDIRHGLRIVGFERRVTIAFVVTDADVTILRVFSGGKN
jgi:toxin ParE1/3/4